MKFGNTGRRSARPASMPPAPLLPRDTFRMTSAALPCNFASRTCLAGARDEFAHSARAAPSLPHPHWTLCRTGSPALYTLSRYVPPPMHACARPARPPSPAAAVRVRSGGERAAPTSRPPPTYPKVARRVPRGVPLVPAHRRRLKGVGKSTAASVRADREEQAWAQAISSLPSDPSPLPSSPRHIAQLWTFCRGPARPLLALEVRVAAARVCRAAATSMALVACASPRLPRVSPASHALQWQRRRR